MPQANATRSRENTRSRLVRAAMAVFAESGVDGASVEAICERAGFTRGAFYSHFASKDELVLELMRHIADDKLERVSERVRELQEHGLPRLTPAEIVVRVLDITTDERLGIVLMSDIRTHAMRDRELAAAYLAMQEQLTERVALLIGGIAENFGLTLRMPAAEAARLLILNWEATSMHVLIAGLGDGAALRLVTERTAMLAAAIADTPA